MPAAAGQEQGGHFGGNCRWSAGKGRRRSELWRYAGGGGCEWGQVTLSL